MPATIRRSAQNSNVYRAYGIMSSHSFANPTALRMDLAKSRADRFRRFLAIHAAGGILRVHV